MKPAILFAVLVLLFRIAIAQESTIHGLIVDKATGEKIPNATITMKGSRIQAVASEEGKFSFSFSGGGEYVFIISHVGYEMLELPVQLLPGEEKQVIAEMVTYAPSGNEVIISASKKAEKMLDAPAPVLVLRSTEINKFPGTNILEMVSRLQGVEYTRSGVDEITVNARGFHNAFNNRVFQLVDGRNTIAAASGNLPMFNNGSIQKDDIEKIEIVLGPQTALYGPNAHNALFNFISKDPRKYPGTTVSFSAGNQYQFSTRLRIAEILSNRFAFKLTGEQSSGMEYEWYDSVYVNIIGTGNPVDEIAIPENINNLGFKRVRGEFHIYYGISSRTELIISTGGSRFTRLQVTPTGRNHLRDVTYGFLQAKLVNKNFYATIYNTWGNLGKTMIIPNYTKDFYMESRHRPVDEAERWASRPGNRLYEASQRLNADLQYNREFENIGLHLSAGFNYQLERPNGFGVTLVDSFTHIKITQYGAVIQADKGLPYDMRLIAAIRLDHHSNFGNYPAPRLALVKRTESGAFRMTMGKAFSMPTIMNQFAGVGRFMFGNSGKGIEYIPNGSPIDRAFAEYTTPLKPEEVKTWEIGYRGDIGKNVFADVNFFRGINKNFISPAQMLFGRVLSVNGIPATQTQRENAGEVDQQGILRNASFITYFNYGKVKTYGVDLGVHYYASRFLVLGFKYSLLKSNLNKEDPSIDANKDGFISPEEKTLNAPENRIIASIEFPNLHRGTLNARFDFRWVESYDFYAGNQMGTKEGKGQRGVMELPGRLIFKNFNRGALGGFKTVDFSLSYKMNTNCRLNISITNLFNTEQIEFVGAPSIRRLFMAELKIDLPEKNKN
jgi:outer membrane receptor for ferrienterochelin and colicins